MRLRLLIGLTADQLKTLLRKRVSKGDQEMNGKEFDPQSAAASAAHAQSVRSASGAVTPETSFTVNLSDKHFTPDEIQALLHEIQDVRLPYQQKQGS